MKSMHIELTAPSGIFKKDAIASHPCIKFFNNPGSIVSEAIGGLIKTKAILPMVKNGINVINELETAFKYF